MSRNSIGLMDRLCILYDLDGYYEGLRLLLDHMTEKGFLLPENRSKVCFVRTLEELADVLGQN